MDSLFLVVCHKTLKIVQQAIKCCSSNIGKVQTVETLQNTFKHYTSDFFSSTHLICVVLQQHTCFLSISFTLFLMVCCKAFLVCSQTQENIAFVTFPSWHTLRTHVAAPPLDTVKWPVSQVVISHIWLWLWLWGSWVVMFLARWWRHCLWSISKRGRML